MPSHYLRNKQSSGLCTWHTVAFAVVAIGSAFLTAPLLAEEPVEESIDPQHSEKMAQGLELFKTTVRDLLKNRCLECHHGAEPDAEFNLATREGLLEGGYTGKAVVLGKPKESLLVKLIQHRQEPEMPYEEGKLPQKQIDAIAKWIELGAPYDAPLDSKHGDVHWTDRKIDPARRDYWAFQPLQSATPPKNDGSTWRRNVIDDFIQAKQREAKVTPNDLAQRRVLIRRAYFDLIGLPPTPAEVDAFVSSKDPDVYAKLIDQLLDSPHFGERWARHWLDVARFAESHGFEQDYNRPHAYHYRDFVIRAFNQDMPFDQFVRWQLAGDEIAPDQPLAMMATGFLGAGVFPTQLTEREFEPARYDEMDDMLATTGTAMLGLTIGCARCHDHKFDPIPQADYYRMLSTFTSTIRSEIELDMTSEQERLAAVAANREQIERLTKEIEAFETEVLPAVFDKFVKEQGEKVTATGPWNVLAITSATSASGTKLELLPDSAVMATGNVQGTDVFTLTSKIKQRTITALRLEALTHSSFSRKGPGLAGNGNFCLSHIEVAYAAANQPEKKQVIKLTTPRATHQQDTGNLSVAASLDGDHAKTGWAVDRGGIGKDQAALFVFDKPFRAEDETELTVKLTFAHPNQKHLMGRMRLATTAHDAQSVALDAKAAPIPAEVATTLRQLAQGEEVNESAKIAAKAWFVTTLPQWQKLNLQLTSLTKPPAPKKTKVMVSSEGVKPIKHHADGRGYPHHYPKTFYLKRGDTAQKEKEAAPSFLQALMPMGEEAARWQVSPPSGAKTSHRRHGLANWITDTDAGAGNLLARVIVNRLWQHHFGQGLVATANDFGAQGTPPSHPELLDYLAQRLIDEGWRLKPIHQLIMTSAAYRQSSQHDEADAAADEQNAFLWRYQPRRLEAEIIRDAMLKVSGQLDDNMFGPGTLSEGMRRRSIYFMVKRSKLIPMMQLFDQPEPLASQGNRPATTIAPQALMFMNNPQVRTYAQAFAAKVSPSQDASMAAAVTAAYEMALARPPKKSELAAAEAFLQQQIKSYEESGTKSARQLALADFCQVLFGLNEFVFVE